MVGILLLFNRLILLYHSIKSYFSEVIVEEFGFLGEVAPNLLEPSIRQSTFARGRCKKFRGYAFYYDVDPWYSKFFKFKNIEIGIFYPKLFIQSYSFWLGITWLFYFSHFLIFNFFFVVGIGLNPYYLHLVLWNINSWFIYGLELVSSWIVDVFSYFLTSYYGWTLVNIVESIYRSMFIIAGVFSLVAHIIWSSIFWGSFFLVFGVVWLPSSIFDAMVLWTESYQLHVFLDEVTSFLGDQLFLQDTLIPFLRQVKMYHYLKENPSIWDFNIFKWEWNEPIISSDWFAIFGHWKTFSWSYYYLDCYRFDFEPLDVIFYDSICFQVDSEGWNQMVLYDFPMFLVLSLINGIVLFYNVGRWLWYVPARMIQSLSLTASLYVSALFYHSRWFNQYDWRARFETLINRLDDVIANIIGDQLNYYLRQGKTFCHATSWDLSYDMGSFSWDIIEFPSLGFSFAIFIYWIFYNWTRPKHMKDLYLHSEELQTTLGFFDANHLRKHFEDMPQDKKISPPSDKFVTFVALTESGSDWSDDGAYTMLNRVYCWYLICFIMFPIYIYYLHSWCETSLVIRWEHFASAISWDSFWPGPSDLAIPWADFESSLNFNERKTYSRLASYSDQLKQMFPNEIIERGVNFKRESWNLYQQPIYLEGENDFFDFSTTYANLYKSSYALPSGIKQGMVDTNLILDGSVKRIMTGYREYLFHTFVAPEEVARDYYYSKGSRLKMKNPLGESHVVKLLKRETLMNQIKVLHQLGTKSEKSLHGPQILNSWAFQGSDKLLANELRYQGTPVRYYMGAVDKQRIEVRYKFLKNAIFCVRGSSWQTAMRKWHIYSNFHEEFIFTRELFREYHTSFWFCAASMFLAYPGSPCHYYYALGLDYVALQSIKPVWQGFNNQVGVREASFQSQLERWGPQLRSEEMLSTDNLTDENLSSVLNKLGSVWSNYRTRSSYYSALYDKKRRGYDSMFWNKSKLPWEIRDPLNLYPSDWHALHKDLWQDPRYHLYDALPGFENYWHQVSRRKDWYHHYMFGSKIRGIPLNQAIGDEVAYIDRSEYTFFSNMSRQSITDLIKGDVLMDRNSIRIKNRKLAVYAGYHDSWDNVYWRGILEKISEYRVLTHNKYTVNYWTYKHPYLDVIPGEYPYHQRPKNGGDYVSYQGEKLHGPGHQIWIKNRWNDLNSSSLVEGREHSTWARYKGVPDEGMNPYIGRKPLAGWRLNQININFSQGRDRLFVKQGWDLLQDTRNFGHAMRGHPGFDKRKVRAEYYPVLDKIWGTIHEALSFSVLEHPEPERRFFTNPKYKKIRHWWSYFGENQNGTYIADLISGFRASRAHGARIRYLYNVSMAPSHELLYDITRNYFFAPLVKNSVWRLPYKLFSLYDYKYPEQTICSQCCAYSGKVSNEMWVKNEGAYWKAYTGPHVHILSNNFKLQTDVDLGGFFYDNLSESLMRKAFNSLEFRLAFHGEYRSHHRLWTRNWRGYLPKNFVAEIPRTFINKWWRDLDRRYWSAVVTYADRAVPGISGEDTKVHVNDWRAGIYKGIPGHNRQAIMDGTVVTLGVRAPQSVRISRLLTWKGFTAGHTTDHTVNGLSCIRIRLSPAAIRAGCPLWKTNTLQIVDSPFCRIRKENSPSLGPRWHSHLRRHALTLDSLALKRADALHRGDVRSEYVYFSPYLRSDRNLVYNFFWLPHPGEITIDLDGYKKRLPYKLRLQSKMPSRFDFAILPKTLVDGSSNRDYAYAGSYGALSKSFNDYSGYNGIPSHEWKCVKDYRRYVDSEFYWKHVLPFSRTNMDRRPRYNYHLGKSTMGNDSYISYNSPRWDLFKDFVDGSGFM